MGRAVRTFRKSRLNSKRKKRLDLRRRKKRQVEKGGKIEGEEGGLKVVEKVVEIVDERWEQVWRIEFDFVVCFHKGLEYEKCLELSIEKTHSAFIRFLYSASSSSSENSISAAATSSSQTLLASLPFKLLRSRVKTN